jgi:hypothetical protein
LRDAELDFGFSSQRADLVPTVPRIGFPKKAKHLRKVMNLNDNESACPTNTEEKRLVSHQALIALFPEVLKL